MVVGLFTTPGKRGKRRKQAIATDSNTNKHDFTPVGGSSSRRPLFPSLSSKNKHNRPQLPPLPPSTKEQKQKESSCGFFESFADCGEVSVCSFDMSGFLNNYEDDEDQVIIENNRSDTKNNKKGNRPNYARFNSSERMESVDELTAVDDGGDADYTINRPITPPEEEGKVTDPSPSQLQTQPSIIFDFAPWVSYNLGISTQTGQNNNTTSPLPGTPHPKEAEQKQVNANMTSSIPTSPSMHVWTASPTKSLPSNIQIPTTTTIHNSNKNYTHSPRPTSSAFSLSQWSSQNSYYYTKKGRISRRKKQRNDYNSYLARKYDKGRIERVLNYLCSDERISINAQKSHRKERSSPHLYFHDVDEGRSVDRTVVFSLDGDDDDDNNNRERNEGGGGGGDDYFEELDDEFSLLNGIEYTNTKTKTKTKTMAPSPEKLEKIKGNDEEDKKSKLKGILLNSTNAHINNNNRNLNGKQQKNPSPQQKLLGQATSTTQQEQNHTPNNTSTKDTASKKPQQSILSIPPELQIEPAGTSESSKTASSSYSTDSILKIKSRLRYLESTRPRSPSRYAHRKKTRPSTIGSGGSGSSSSVSTTNKGSAYSNKKHRQQQVLPSLMDDEEDDDSSFKEDRQEGSPTTYLHTATNHVKTHRPSHSDPAVSLLLLDTAKTLQDRRRPVTAKNEITSTFDPDQSQDMYVAFSSDDISSSSNRPRPTSSTNATSGGAGINASAEGTMEENPIIKELRARLRKIESDLTLGSFCQV